MNRQSSAQGTLYARPETHAMEWYGRFGRKDAFLGDADLHGGAACPARKARDQPSSKRLTSF